MRSTANTPVILLGGALCSPRLWDRVIQDLVSAGHPASRFISLPTSTFINGHTHTSMNSAVLQFLSTLNSIVPSNRKFAVVGLSMGGYVALTAGGICPHRISGLALINSQCRPDSKQIKAGVRVWVSLCRS